jgi:hypothetical protein
MYQHLSDEELLQRRWDAMISGIADTLDLLDIYADEAGDEQRERLDEFAKVVADREAVMKALEEEAARRKRLSNAKRIIQAVANALRERVEVMEQRYSDSLKKDT